MKTKPLNELSIIEINGVIQLSPKDQNTILMKLINKDNINANLIYATHASKTKTHKPDDYKYFNLAEIAYNQNENKLFTQYAISHIQTVNDYHKEDIEELTELPKHWWNNKIILKEIENTQQTFTDIDQHHLLIKTLYKFESDVSLCINIITKTLSFLENRDDTSTPRPLIAPTIFMCYILQNKATKAINHFLSSEFQENKTIDDHEKLAWTISRKKNIKTIRVAKKIYNDWSQKKISDNKIPHYRSLNIYLYHEVLSYLDNKQPKNTTRKELFNTTYSQYIKNQITNPNTFSIIASKIKSETKIIFDLKIKDLHKTFENMIYDGINTSKDIDQYIEHYNDSYEIAFTLHKHQYGDYEIRIKLMFFALLGSIKDNKYSLCTKKIQEFNKINNNLSQRLHNIFIEILAEKHHYYKAIIYCQNNNLPTQEKRCINLLKILEQ